MSDPTIRKALAAAVNRAFDAWASEHPNLAAVIDRIRLTEHAAANIRETPEYAAAVDAYRRERSDVELLRALTEVALPVVSRFLPG
jgi:hypothetical protein